MAISGDRNNSAPRPETGTDQSLSSTDSGLVDDAFGIGNIGRMAPAAAPRWLSLIEPVHETITGSNGGDTLSARADGDIVYGLGGNDTLSSTFNRTALIGGTGNDRMTTTVIVPFQSTGTTHGTAVQIGGDGRDRLDATVTLQGGDTSQFVEGRTLLAELSLDGGRDSDVIHAVANVGGYVLADATITNRILGGGGNDVIDALADARGAFGYNRPTNIVNGGAGNDRITASILTDTIASSATAINALTGGDGNDILDASARGQTNFTDLVKNTLDGGRGNDVLRAYNLTNSNSGAPVGINELRGGDGKDVLDATIEAPGNRISDITNRLSGGSGADRLTASLNAVSEYVRAVNQLDGGAQNDRLVAKTDIESYGSGSPPPSNYPDAKAFNVSNILNGGSGNDRLEASLSVKNESYSIDDGSHAENRLNGGIGNDTLVATVVSGSGYVGASFLSGGSGNDRLTVFGGSGNVLNGGAGRDTLIGGTGDDHFTGGGGNDRYVFALQNGHDTVRFEDGKDVMDLRAFAASNIHGFGDLNIETVGADSVIHFDANNDITVIGVTRLSASDFLFA